MVVVTVAGLAGSVGPGPAAVVIVGFAGEAAIRAPVAGSIGVGTY